MQFLSNEIEQYLSDYSAPHDIVLEELTRETNVKVQMPQMLSGNIQGKFLRMFAELSNAKNILEIGTFTGYSAICMATGMSDDGRLITIDVNEELSAITTKYFEKSGQANKIQSLFGNALQLIPNIKNTFDIVFIDADKQNYCNYYTLVFDKVRAGGYIIADNVLWSGKVVEEYKDKDTLAIHQYNKMVKNDSRVSNYILPLRDGLNIARKL